MKTRKQHQNHWTTRLLLSNFFMLAGPFAASANSLLQPAVQKEALSAERLGLDLRFDNLGVNTLGLDLNYQLPWSGLERINLLAGVGTNRFFGLMLPGLVPVDYGKIGLQYRIPLSAWIEPYAGLQLRLAGSSLNRQQFPELSQINTTAIAVSLAGGSRFQIYPHLSALLEVNLSYPPSFAIPYLSWALGASYSFAVTP